MKKKRSIWRVLLGLVFAPAVLSGCFKFENQSDDNPKTPQVKEFYVDSISRNSAIIVGNVYSNSYITSRGFYWSSTSINPSENDNKTENGSGNGRFTATLTGLTANTKYYVTVYAINSYGKELGGTITFTTSPEVPVVSTSIILEYTRSTALVGGQVTFEGLTPVTERGVYWSLSANPETSGKKLQIGNGIGNFSANLIELSPGTDYYIKAFATNSSGTAFGLQYSFNTGQSTTIPTVTDADGNVYYFVKIGNQEWMSENLKTTRYNDGTLIPMVTKNLWELNSSPAYSFYNDNDTTYKPIYGAFYNFYTVKTGKLCPTGWHVPTDAEWTTMTTFLGGESVAGAKMKETGNAHWPGPNSDATNVSFFTGLPGCSRSSFGGEEGLGTFGCWWSSTETGEGRGWSRSLSFASNDVLRNGSETLKNWGCSVRCIKDN